MGYKVTSGDMNCGYFYAPYIPLDEERLSDKEKLSFRKNEPAPGRVATWVEGIIARIGNKLEARLEAETSGNPVGALTKILLCVICCARIILEDDDDEDVRRLRSFVKNDKLKQEMVTERNLTLIER